MGAAATCHQRSPRANASELLEDEAVSVQGLEGWCREEEVP
jgi:hypothetical protein